MNSAIDKKVNFFGSGAVFDHIGMAVFSLDDTGINFENVYHDPVQKVAIAFAEVDGINIEFIEAATSDSPISEQLEKGQKLLHLCYRVPDIEMAVEYSRKYKFHSLTLPAPAVAFQQNKIIWVYHKVFGLFELVEDPELSER